jgi:hypothetical protein
MLLAYNRHFVEKSVDLLLDGTAGSPPILKLGAANVIAAQALEVTRGNLTTLQGRRQDVDTARRSLVRERDPVRTCRR